MVQEQEKNVKSEPNIDSTQNRTDDNRQGLFGTMHDGFMMTPELDNTLEFEKIGNGITVFDDFFESVVNGVMQTASDVLGNAANRSAQATMAGIDYLLDKAENVGKTTNNEHVQEMAETKEQGKEVSKEKNSDNERNDKEGQAKEQEQHQEEEMER